MVKLWTQERIRTSVVTSAVAAKKILLILKLNLRANLNNLKTTKDHLDVGKSKTVPVD